MARIIDRSCGARSHSASFSVWNLPRPSRCEWMYLTSPSSPASISSFSFSKAGWKRSTWPTMKMRPLPWPPRTARSASAHGQRDRLFDQHVLAGFDRADGEIGMELRRQRHDDGVDVVAREQLVGLDGQAILLAGETFGARPVGVGDGMQRAERLQGADMVRAPVSASKDCNARFHQLANSGICGGHITARRVELKPAPPQASGRQAICRATHMAGAPAASKLDRLALPNLISARPWRTPRHACRFPAHFGPFAALAG